jgi:hypothetical protein
MLVMTTTYTLIGKVQYYTKGGSSLLIEYFSYIIIGDYSQIIYYIKNTDDVIQELATLSKGDIIELKGLGKLIIKEMSYNAYLYQEGGVQYQELGFICEEVA